MFKWLLLFAGASLVYLWIKGKKQAQLNAENSSEPSKNKPERPSEPEVMVQCQCCKVHLPKSEAFTFDDRFYCSKEHLHALDSNGWVGDALWSVSPNQDLRPENVIPDLVVIHHISLPPGEFRKQSSSQHIVDFFQNKLDPNAHPYFAEIADQKVSSHFLIARSGDLIQFVSTQNKAWHAGVSSFFGREKCNDFSIGIEMEGDGDSPFEDAQYQVLVNLIQKLAVTYPHLQFAGHSDIAPDRKTDPGMYFDWKKFQKETGILPERLPFGLSPR
ncbi:1,6-anhydro-N-acetylmuramyl-L-alanine amidase AmpD [Polynucleobacter sp. JS-JIR-II-c23]|uniref:1,6-anhydro-N-acetylmuramyl-L-alanine amidase AmpD n=1 Tax=Polynucleobacter sp. JS-JIR-II-c23 TaxID=1758393 RepID=UPI002B22E7C2|nr:1,6-anhydro-N-acetylmuramyl-L-alanine amidase AmpD [Polynucleobacter sp. JS-JIR-II-c23]MEA9604759.1 1,6-anhydro-N-acetylmuramyl-L-alanine amidase AmpD [Polynucleobacter sp. JS-JIR-II-c23]